MWMTFIDYGQNSGLTSLLKKNLHPCSLHPTTIRQISRSGPVFVQTGPTIPVLCITLLF
uniref:Uncharacterized protein n=1 Tax=Anguilla anguilla TaxID=7936 RepID=A0A0E9XMZ8_ANGAN